MIKIFFLLLFFVFVGCQNKPTKVIEESVNVFANNIVIVDTRSAFLYTSYHIEGSVNLNTSDYLILKNPRKKIYNFDPDLQQTIERLAHRGITPEKKVILLSDTVNSVESKKWRWLLKSIEVDDVLITTLDEFKKQHKNPRFSEPTRENPWVLKISKDLQKELIIKKAKECFVKWSDKNC